MKPYKLLIGGELVDGDSTTQVVDPANETVLATCPRGSASQMDAAVAAAGEAFRTWSRVDISERQAKLLALANAIEGRQDELARLLTEEQGKPLPDAMAEFTYACAFIRQLSHLDLPITVLENGPLRWVEQHRRPLGVVGAIIPGNFPVLIIAFKIPPALLAGNTVVIKPAPITPLTTLRIGEIIAEIFPPGVINIVTDLYDLGGHLMAHPDVATLALRMETGTAWIKKHLYFDPTMPFGGPKLSGIGVEFAEEELAEFTQAHIVTRPFEAELCEA